jgi:hypothetical protein
MTASGFRPGRLEAGVDSEREPILGRVRLGVVDDFQERMRRLDPVRPFDGQRLPDPKPDLAGFVGEIDGEGVARRGLEQQVDVGMAFEGAIRTPPGGEPGPGPVLRVASSGVPAEQGDTPLDWRFYPRMASAGSQGPRRSRDLPLPGVVIAWPQPAQQARNAVALKLPPRSSR